MLHVLFFNAFVPASRVTNMSGSEDVEMGAPGERGLQAARQYVGADGGGGDRDEYGYERADAAPEYAAGSRTEYARLDGGGTTSLRDRRYCCRGKVRRCRDDERRCACSIVLVTLAITVGVLAYLGGIAGLVTLGNVSSLHGAVHRSGQREAAIRHDVAMLVRLQCLDAVAGGPGNGSADPYADERCVGIRNLMRVAVSTARPTLVCGGDASPCHSDRPLELWRMDDVVAGVVPSPIVCPVCASEPGAAEAPYVRAVAGLPWAWKPADAEVRIVRGFRETGEVALGRGDRDGFAFIPHHPRDDSTHSHSLAWAMSPGINITNYDDVVAPGPGNGLIVPPHTFYYRAEPDPLYDL